MRVCSEDGTATIKNVHAIYVMIQVIDMIVPVGTVLVAFLSFLVVGTTKLACAKCSIEVLRFSAGLYFSGRTTAGTAVVYMTPGKGM